MLLAATARKLAAAQAACETLSGRFDVVVANPPYMGSSSFNPFMGKWMKKRYPDVKSDLFAAFIVRIMDYANDHGEVGIMSPFVWMFIGSYEKLRNKLIDEKTITSLIQLEYSGFAGATVPICTFTYHNMHIDGYKGGYIRLSDFVGASVQAPKALEAIQNPACGWFYRADATTFHDIPGSPIAYWASEGLHIAFRNGIPLASSCIARDGIHTCNNDLFLRRWWEPSRKLESLTGDESRHNKRWFAYNKGGSFRKWRGNNEYVIDWENDGERLKHAPNAHGFNGDYAFIPSITWSSISSGRPAFRHKPKGFLFDAAGYSMFCQEGLSQQELCGFTNSSVAEAMLSFLSPTLNYQAGDILSMPFLRATHIKKAEIEAYVNSNLLLSQTDFDSQETSWDFKRNSLI